MARYEHLPIDVGQTDGLGRPLVALRLGVGDIHGNSNCSNSLFNTSL